jgi:hypothetical protein
MRKGSEEVPNSIKTAKSHQFRGFFVPKSNRAPSETTSKEKNVVWGFTNFGEFHGGNTTNSPSQD